jgi:RNA polymerase-binding transcription factor DksA
LKRTLGRKIMSKDSSKAANPFFSLDDVEEVLKKNKKERPKPEAAKAPTKKAVSKKQAVPKQPEASAAKQGRQRLGAVSASDILGFQLNEPEPVVANHDESRVPKKFLSYYRQLIELRKHVLSGLDFHTQDTLRRSSKDDSGDLSSYGQHMADAGTETFDRDFALSLVSSEKEALHEIEKAIERIFDGSYGICKVTGKPIAKERLQAVPFTRFSVEGQIEFEKSQKKTVQRGGAFAETVEESAAFSSDDDGDDS